MYVTPGGILLEEVNGVKEYMYLDETEEKLYFQKIQDVEPILEDAKARHKEHGGKNKAGDFYHAGRFPPVLIEEWLRIRGLNMRDFKGEVVDRFLNDPEHSAFRIWQGRV